MTEIVAKIIEGLFSVTQMMGVPSYALAILFLTIIIKILLHPTTIKQQKAAKTMQTLQPKIKALEKKYGNNPQKKQEATMALYKEENFSPFSSCLPLLFQMPILLVLFYGLRSFTPDYLEYFNFFWVTDLRNPDPTMVLPILCGLLTFLQQYLSMVNRQDRTQRMMLFIMPVMFLFIAKSFPAALALYWVFYTFLSTLQTLYINYRLGIGLFAPPELKEKSLITKAAENYDKQQEKQQEDKKRKENPEEYKKEEEKKRKEKEKERKLPDKPWQVK